MSRNDLHARTSQRRIGVGLALAGAAAAAALALTATSPAAKADTVDVPDVPDETGIETGQEYFGLTPLFQGDSFEGNGNFTDLLGYNVDTTSPGDLPLDWDSYAVPDDVNPSFQTIGVTNPNVDAVTTDGTVGGSTFGEFALPIGSATSGLVDIYEETPFYANLGTGATDNVSETWEFVTQSTTVDFGVQYLDLPDAATPVDEINVFGSGGDILFSIPVTGDLLASSF
jgi:hypothetical protein